MIFKNQGGMSLIEVMVALLLLGVAIIPMLNLFVDGSAYTATARHEVSALNFAQAIMEEIKSIPFIQMGQVQAAGAGTLQFEDKSSGNYINYMVAVTSGPGAGQVREITSYDYLTRTATVDQNWSSMPGVTSTYLIIQNNDRKYNYRIDASVSGDLVTITLTAYYSIRGRTKNVCLITDKPKR